MGYLIKVVWFTEIHLVVCAPTPQIYHRLTAVPFLSRDGITRVGGTCLGVYSLIAQSQ